MADRILVVEDEKDLAQVLEYNLRQAGFDPLVAYDGAAGLRMARDVRPALVLLDLMLPDLNGIEVCKRLKADKATAGMPVVMLTARAEESDRVSGLEAGADDYVTKPFSVREVMLRVRAVLRRANVKTAPAGDGEAHGVLRLDRGAHRVHVDGDEIELTATEFRLLTDLIDAAGRVRTRDALLDRVWGYAPEVGLAHGRHARAPAPREARRCRALRRHRARRRLLLRHLRQGRLLSSTAPSRPHWRGFRGRLLLSHLAVALAVLAGVVLTLDVAIRGHLGRALEAELAREAALVAEAVEGMPGEMAAMDALADRMGASLESRVTIIEPDGHLSGDSDVPLIELPAVENHGSRPEVVAAVASGTGTAARFSTTVHDRMIYAAHRASAGRVVRVARSTAKADAAASSARNVVLGTGVVAAVLSALLAATVSGALARPIRAVTGVAREMASGNLASRITMRRSDELGELADALNDLAASFARTIEEVTEERNRLAAVLAGMVEGVLVVDASGRVVLMNPSLREILLIQNEVAGRTVLEAVRSPELHAAVSAVLGGSPPSARVITLPGTNKGEDSTDPGRDRTIEVRFSILRADNPDSRLAGLVAVFHDITDLKRLEQVRKDFVANASHELKTPVAAILGASETLSLGASGDPVAGPRFLEVIGRHASRLAALVDDLLDLSRLEARAAEAMTEVHPADALSRAAGAFRESAAAKKIDLRVGKLADVPGVRGDPALMDRALTNLVQNAVRYTPSGGKVVLRAVRHDGSVRFEVEDTGIGIPPQALARIFERFYRVDPARSRELGGTGLGLAIVKHAVEAMGGKVAVKSVPDHGSTFSFTLPIWHE